jgi:hypothetical protein
MKDRSFRPLRQVLDSVSALSSYDPAQARIIGLFGLISVLFIGVWGLYGELFIPNLVVEIVAVVLIAAAVITIASLTGQLIRAHDRWQVESAFTFRQLMSEGSKTGGGFQVGSPFYAQQLRSRLQETIGRARSYGTSVSLIAMRLELMGQSPSHAVFTQTNHEVAELTARNRDTMLAPTALGMFEYAFFLANADRKTAQAFAQFLMVELKRYRCSFGIVVCPEDGQDADQLLREAMAASGMLLSAA